MVGADNGRGIMRSAFIGRDAEMARLLEILDRVKGGTGRVVLLAGEAGIGKTRILDETLARAQALGFRTFHGTCLYRENADPYLPVLDALAGSTPGERGEGALPFGLGGSRSKSNLPIGVGIGRTTEVPEPVEAHQMQEERGRMFESVARQLAEAAEQKPVVLALSDLHWADEATLQLLHYVASGAREMPLLILGSYRPEELQREGDQGPLSTLIARLRKERLIEVIELERMSEDDIKEFIRNLLDLDDVPGAFAKRLHEESEGNPFFVQEVLKSLIDEGVIDPHAYRWDVSGDLSSVRLPRTLADAVGRRVARLDDQTRKVLNVAVVIGYTFDFEVLRQVSQLDEEVLLDALDVLIEAKILHEEAEDVREVYRFDHMQILNVVYEGLSRSRQRLLHKRIGEVVEKLAKDAEEEPIYQLAKHFTRGKSYPKALRYNKAASARARSQLDANGAIRYLGDALKVVPFVTDIDQERETALLHGIMGELKESIGDPTAAKRHYEHYLEYARTHSMHAEQADALRRLGNVARNTAQFQRAEEFLGEALELAARINDRGLEADIQRGLGYILWRKGDNEAAIERYNQAISLSLEVNDRRELAVTSIELGNVFTQKGEYIRAREFYQKAIQELENLGDHTELARALNNMGDSHLLTGEWDEAIKYFERCKEIGEKSGNRADVAWSMFNAAQAYLEKNEFDIAERYCDRALRICEALDDKIGMSGVFANYGRLYRKRGRFDKAVEFHNKGIVLLEMLNIPYDLAGAWKGLALTHRAAGNTAEATRILQKVADIYAEIDAWEDHDQTVRLLEEQA